MPRSFWIPASLLGLGVVAIAFLSLRHGATEESCATCAAATIGPQDVKVAAKTPDVTGLQPQPETPRPTSCGPTRPALEEDEAPDFSGVGIELLRTRGLAKLPSREERVSPEELRARIERSLARFFPEGYGMKEGRALTALGAIPSPVDTVARRAELWSVMLGAWRDPEVDKMLLAQSDDDMLPRQHALGQALAFLLRERIGWLKKDAAATTDAWLARLGLLAGDATLTTTLRGTHASRKGHEANTPPDKRDFLQELDQAVFSTGENFAKALHHLGEFDQLNAAYERPPVATAELLDAGLYFSEKQFEPRQVNWMDAKVAGQDPFWDDALGELGIRIFLSQQMPPEKTDEASSGWEGDRWLAYDAGSEARGHVAWQTFWKDKEAADKFFAAMQQFLRAKHPEAPLGTEDKGLWRWTGGGRSVTLTRTDDGRGVFYADAGTAEFAEALRAKFLKP